MDRGDREYFRDCNLHFAGYSVTRMSWLLLCHPVPFLCCSAAVEALEVLEARYAAFAAAAASSALKGSCWSQGVVALDMVLSVLFSACTRVSQRASYISFATQQHC